MSSGRSRVVPKKIRIAEVALLSFGGRAPFSVSAALSAVATGLTTSALQRGLSVFGGPADLLSGTTHSRNWDQATLAAYA